jgi:hypothetical protein
MLIDIDIKIADNDGNLVHHFEKRLDDEDTASLKKLNNNYFAESFEDFLSEYMSFSGHQVREKLKLGDSVSRSITPSFPTDGTISFKRGNLYNLENNEIEYKIRIGNKNVFIERMPLEQTPILVETNDIPVESENESQNTPSLDHESSLSNLIKHAMPKVIAKYEANLYPISKAEEYECN